MAFNLYVAHVQDSFLDKFDFPTQEPQPESGLDIFHWRIPPEPIETLPERLTRALMLDCCGKTPDARSPNGCWQGLGQKRQRENDTDTDMLSKKCKSSGSQIAIE
jgi:hypothetical protein